MNEKIGVFDSGLGGLSVLKEMIRLMPNEDYLFYEDSINNPYGNKSDEELLKITSRIVDYLIEKKCKIIVIACNTATTSCMKKLRKMYPNTIFVGTVPAIKVAYDNNYKSTIILSTNYTMKSKRVHELITDYRAANQELINVSGRNLASLIELDKKKEIDIFLEGVLGKYRGKVDSLILGCTHYSLIKKEISKVLPGVELIDGTLGVAKEVRRNLEKNNLLNNSENKGKILIENTKDERLIERSYKILGVVR